MKKKLIAFLMALACTASLLTACGGSGSSTAASGGTASGGTEPQEKVTLKFYQFQAGLVDQMDALCAEFIATHPGIEVVADRPGDYYFNLLKTMFASNQGPDIFSINSWTMVEDYADAGIALDLSGDCLLYTSDAADELDGVDLGGRRIIKKKFFQAEDGIRDRSPSRGLGDVYKRQQ